MWRHLQTITALLSLAFLCSCVDSGATPDDSGSERSQPQYFRMYGGRAVLRSEDPRTTARARGELASDAILLPIEVEPSGPVHGRETLTVSFDADPGEILFGAYDPDRGFVPLQHMMEALPGGGYRAIAEVTHHSILTVVSIRHLNEALTCTFAARAHAETYNHSAPGRDSNDSMAHCVAACGITRCWSFAGVAVATGLGLAKELCDLAGETCRADAARPWYCFAVLAILGDTGPHIMCRDFGWNDLLSNDCGINTCGPLAVTCDECCGTTGVSLRCVAECTPGAVACESDGGVVRTRSCTESPPFRGRWGAWSGCGRGATCGADAGCLVECGADGLVCCPGPDRTFRECSAGLTCDLTSGICRSSLVSMDAGVGPDAPRDVVASDRSASTDASVDVTVDRAFVDLSAPPDASITDISVSCTLPHTMNCGTGCVDTWSDNANCGRCATRCATAYHCALGTCVADTPACTGASMMRCGSVCVNTLTDSANCGRCSTVCPSSQRCSSGACVPIDPCASVSCPECQTCRSGTCAPIADLTACSLGRECYGGVCAARCATNYCQTYGYSSGAWCDGNSIVRCTTSGRCLTEASRVVCPTPCVAGACTACPANLADCDGNPANGCEADLRTSAANCGTCRFGCASGVACHGGICDGSATKLALGSPTHTCALTTLGTAQCWGENLSGQLGNGVVLPVRSEVTPVGVVDLTNAIDLAAARDVACAIRAGGAVVCWGQNRDGQLGNGAAGMWAGHFVSTVGITNARQITGGWDHMCAVTTADTMLCWGYNLDGRLGDGTTTSRASPTAVAGLTNVAQADAGPYQTCAVRRDGTVSCWGDGTMGRLGTGTIAYQLRPAAVVGISNATAVACSKYSTCVVRADATVACTGGNDNGELGDGTTTRRLTMGPVPGLSDVVQLVMGDTHACVVRRDGTVWCWGSNGYGQLGDGTTTARSVPTRVPGVVGAREISAGGAHTCALLAGGRIACWGENAAGQLGDGTTTNRSAPVTVVLR